jgi:serine/threonine protein kinase/tetratricopeptide (TPR) repeat protein
MIGKMISHYKILEKLGEGGLGVVYKAEDTKLKRTVALKFLKPEALASEEHRVRFMHEAQAAASLDHTNICTVYEIGEAEGTSFIAMAYIEGEGLAGKIARGPLPLEEVVSIGIQVAEGLQAAHEKGIIHRDIKSANVRLTSRGTAEILDFGIARVAGEAAITREGTTIGTGAYMSPEQAQGEAIDHRTDIWSFGVMLHEMITGQLPFKGEYTSAVIYSLLNEEPEPVTALRTGVPMELERIVLKSLSKNPGQRYQHMDEVLVDLREVKQELETGTTRLHPVTARREAAPSGVSLVKDLAERRVPQIVGVYVAVGVGIVYLMSRLVNNYPLSPNLPTFTLLVLASMIPTVLLLAYFHGSAGRGGWRNVEKIGIPANVIASVALLITMFHGQELGAATTTVTVMDDEGQAIARRIPKTEFRKKVAVFYFSNETGDSAYDWMQYGITEMLDYDLKQDLYVWTDSDFSQSLEDAGVKEGIGAPLALKKKISQDGHYRHFVSGSLDKRGDTLLISTTLYETEQSRPVAQRSFTGSDIFGLVDLMSTQLKHDLDLPRYHIEETEDLPVAERLTSSLPALISYTAHGYEERYSHDYEAAARHLADAVTDDPAFALAHYGLIRLYRDLNRPADAEAALRAAMQHSYKLPESYRFELRFTYHWFNEDVEAARENAESWVQLYPESIDAHRSLARCYRMQDRLRDAIAEGEAILELDPEQYDELNSIAQLYTSLGEFDDALRYYEIYAEQFPGQARSYTSIGSLYRTIGDYERARTYYGKARVVEPEKVEILADLAEVEIRLGNFDEAVRQFEEALDLADVSEERTAVYYSLINYYKFRGQIRKALETNALYTAECKKTLSPLAVMLESMDRLDLYVLIGEEDAAFGIIEGIRAAVKDSPVARWLPAIGNVAIYMVLDDPERIEEYKQAVDDTEAFVELSHFEQLRVLVFAGRAGIHALKGEHSEAIASYEKAIATSRQDPGFRVFANVAMAGCCRELGELKSAEKRLQNLLKLEPVDPEVHYETALVYHEMGKTDQAREHLNKALWVWEDADPEFKPAKEARQTLAQWQSLSS